tara:strand:+ start:1092 stop:1886 length:795 start_codon:yes stop_codon:yes gene_type:complete
MEKDHIIRDVVRQYILVEAKTQSKRLRAFTNKITREVMRLYNHGFSSASQEITYDDLVHDPTLENAEIYEINAGHFPIAFDPETLDPDFEAPEDLDTFITVVVEIKKNSSKFNVSASDKSMTGMSDFGLHLAIETPKNFSREKLVDLRSEVANSVRHELEHITQGPAVGQSAGTFGRGSSYWSFTGGPEDVSSSMAKYLLQPEEIPAHVRGYTQNAKNLRSLKAAFNSLFQSYVGKNLITKAEAKTIERVWLDWASENIHSKGF